MKKLKTIFMGTPEFAINSLIKINEITDLKLIITKEDKVNQRGNKIKYSPVKEYAISNNIEYIQPKKMKDDELINKIKNINPDVIVVVAYGKIIPKEIIEIPKYIINVHSSLLPKYRGASPIHSAIINGDKKTGVSIMLIEETLDSGDVLNVEETKISEDDTLYTLTDRLSKLGAVALEKTIFDIENNSVKRVKQDESKVSFVYPIKKEETKIDFSKTKEEIFNLVRGLNPSPLAYMYYNNLVVKVLQVEKSEEIFEGCYGEIVKITKKDIYIKVKNGCILLKKAKFEGKKEQTSIDLINGRKVKLNELFN